MAETCGFAEFEVRSKTRPQASRGGIPFAVCSDAYCGTVALRSADIKLAPDTRSLGVFNVVPRKDAHGVVSALDELRDIEHIGVNFSMLGMGRWSETGTVTVNENAAAAGRGDLQSGITAHGVAVEFPSEKHKFLRFAGGVVVPNPACAADGGQRQFIVHRQSSFGILFFIDQIFPVLLVLTVCGNGFFAILDSLTGTDFDGFDAC